MKITVDIKKLWKKHKGKVILILMAKLGAAYYFSKDVVYDYLDRQDQIEFNERMIKSAEDTSVFAAFIGNEQFVRMLMKSPAVSQHTKDLGNEIHANIIAARISKDSTKVSSRDYIGAISNTHPDSVLAFQAKIFIYFKMLEQKGLQLTTDEEFNTLKDVLENQDIKTEPRRRRRINVSF